MAACCQYVRQRGHGVAATGSGRDPERRARWLRARGSGSYGTTLGVLSVAVVTFPLVQSMFVPALPAIQRDLNGGTSATAATYTVSLVAAAVSTPIVGSVGDSRSARSVMLGVLSTFLVGSVVAALATSMLVLVLARAVQGVGGALLPLAFMVLRRRFSLSEATRGVAFLSGLVGAGSALGLVASGLLLEVASYRVLFVVSIAQVVVSLVGVGVFLARDDAAGSGSRFDIAGASLLSVGVASMVLAVTQASDWGVTSARVLGLACLSVFASAAWVRWERRVEHPLVAVELLTDPRLLRANLVSFLTAPAVFGFFVLAPQLAQAPRSTGYGFGASVLETGLMLLPLSCFMMLSGGLAGRWLLRVSAKRLVVVGGLSTTAALLALGLTYSRVLGVVTVGAVVGIGVGMLFGGIGAAVIDIAPPQLIGAASSTVAASRLIGGAVGGQIVAAVLATKLIPGTDLPTESSFVAAFVGLGVIAGTGVLASLALRAPATSYDPPATLDGLYDEIA